MVDVILIIFGVVFILILLIALIGGVIIMFKFLNWFYPKWVIENKSIDTIITDEIRRRGR
jgi:Na+-transporting methylmalonyl-CoA/oxaloacetate decarboxylase gamma subunit